jgi:glycerol-3-phosphate acyltransferase PlsY
MANEVLIGAIIAGSYLLGSLPFGLWVTKAWTGIDIRTVGSGNVGATNVWRTCGAKVGSVVFALDVLKGLAPPLVGLALHLPSYWQIAFGMTAILGHIFSFLLKFKGGKGVATGLGAFLGIAPYVAGVDFIIWLALVLATQYVSVGSLVACVGLTALMPVFYPGDPYRLGFGVVCTLLGIYTHRANVKRLLNGTENKTYLFGKKKTAPNPGSNTPANPAS